MIVNVTDRGPEILQDRGARLLDQGASEMTVRIDLQEMIGIVMSTKGRNIGMSEMLIGFLKMTPVTGVMTVNGMNGWLHGVL